MIGQARLCISLHLGGAEPKIKDVSGKKWDFVMPAAFHFVYGRDKMAKLRGILLESTHFFAN